MSRATLQAATEVALKWLYRGKWVYSVGQTHTEASVDSIIFIISSRLWLLVLEISVFNLEWFMTTSSQGVSGVTWSGYMLLGKIIM